MEYIQEEIKEKQEKMEKAGQGAEIEIESLREEIQRLKVDWEENSKKINEKEEVL